MRLCVTVLTRVRKAADTAIMRSLLRPHAGVQAHLVEAGGAAVAQHLSAVPCKQLPLSGKTKNQTIPHLVPVRRMNTLKTMCMPLSHPTMPARPAAFSLRVAYKRFIQIHRLRCLSRHIFSTLQSFTAASLGLGVSAPG